MEMLGLPSPKKKKKKRFNGTIMICAKYRSVVGFGHLQSGSRNLLLFSSDLSQCLSNFSPSYVCSVCSVDVRSGNVTLLGVLWFTEGRICIEIDR